MDWNDFQYIFMITSFCWIMSLFLVYKKKNVLIRLGEISFLLGIVTLIVFVTSLWENLGRPPLRTLGETRIWYSTFLPIIAYIIFKRWNYKWILAYSSVVSLLFQYINLSNPDILDKDLMPALQSSWFIPHVIVYMFAYALLCAASLTAIYGLYKYYTKDLKNEIILISDNLVYIGFGFLTFGLLFGALWAKEAWGHYWTWDPKETWAFITWISYLIYIHLRKQKSSTTLKSLWSLSIAVIVLLICWFGVNYLPTASSSVHTYSG